MKPRKTNRIIVRVLRVLAMLERAGGVTAEEIACEIECTKRQAYRYLAAIEESGIPLTSDTRDDGQTYHIRAHKRRTPSGRAASITAHECKRPAVYWQRFSP